MHNNCEEQQTISLINIAAVNTLLPLTYDFFKFLDAKSERKFTSVMKNYFVIFASGKTSLNVTVTVALRVTNLSHYGHASGLLHIRLST